MISCITSLEFHSPLYYISQSLYPPTSPCIINWHSYSELCYYANFRIVISQSFSLLPLSFEDSRTSINPNDLILFMTLELSIVVSPWFPSADSWCPTGTLDLTHIKVDAFCACLNSRAVVSPPEVDPPSST